MSLILIIVDEANFALKFIGVQKVGVEPAGRSQMVHLEPFLRVIFMYLVNLFGILTLLGIWY